MWERLKKGKFTFGLQGLFSMLIPYLICLKFTNSTEALISALVSLFMFIELRGFGFKRRIAQSLFIIGTQIAILVVFALFFSKHYLLALPFNFAFFFWANYYNFFDTPNSLKLISIQYFYLFALTTPIEAENIHLRLFAIFVALLFAAIGLLWIWPSKTHKKVEASLSNYLSYSRKMMEMSISDYQNVAVGFRREQNERFNEIMQIIYGLKYGSIFSTSKGKYLFKMAVNTQILNNSLHYVKKSNVLEALKQGDEFFAISEKWKNTLISVFKYMEKTVTEDKHSLLLLEKEIEKLQLQSKQIQSFLSDKDVKKLQLRFTEIQYQINSLLEFCKLLILYKHKTEGGSKRGNFNFLYTFDNFRNITLRSLNIKNSPVRFALHMSILLTSGLLLISYFDVFEGFWIPMTILLILKPNHGGTKKQTINRLGGTAVGLIISIIVIYLLPVYLVSPMLLFSYFMALSYFKDDYGLAVVFITLGVVLLMATEFNPEEIFIYRLMSTSATAILVLASSYVIFPNWSKFEIREKMIEALDNDRKVVTELLKKANSEDADKNSIRINILNAYQLEKEIKELYVKMQAEPKQHQLNMSLGNQFLVAHDRFYENYNRVAYEILTNKNRVDLPYNEISAYYNNALKSIIKNLRFRENLKSSKREENLLKTYSILVDRELNGNLNDEQLILVEELKRSTKRLIELKKLSENDKLIFVN